jgi:hypothetical protein
MLQAAGVDDKSYSVRHGMEEHRGLPACLLLRARHIRVPRPALSRETLLSTIAVANVDTRFRTIEGRCSVICLSTHLHFNIAISHIPGMLWQPHVNGSGLALLLIRSVIKVSSIALAIRLVITACSLDKHQSPPPMIP